MDTYINPIHHDGEDYYIAVRNEITDRKRAEEENLQQQKQLLQADKMSSLGILTSGVAHEINNPNHLIMSNNSLLERVWEDIWPILRRKCNEDGNFDLAGIPCDQMEKLIPDMFERIRGGTERIRNIVDGLKHFAKEDQAGMDQWVELNAIVESAIPLVDSLVKKSTDHFSLKLGSNLPRIRGNFQQLEQVFINFVTNACQALPHRQASIVVHTEFDAGSQQLRLMVKDEGTGIDPAIQSKVMDPFFTTKQDSGGTGLGLFVSYGIVQCHGGRLRFEDDGGCRAILEFDLLPEGEGKAWA